MARKISGKIGKKKFNINLSNNNPRIGSTQGWNPKFTPQEIAQLKGSARRAAKKYNKMDYQVSNAQLANAQLNNKLKYATVNNAISQIGVNQLANTATSQAQLDAIRATNQAGSKPSAPTGSTNVGSSNTDSTNSMDWIK